MAPQISTGVGRGGAIKTQSLTRRQRNNGNLSNARKKKLAGNDDESKKIPKEDLMDKIPQELRNMIYKEALLELPEPNSTASSRKIFPQFDGSREPALLMSSKQIRFEASPIYYLGNHFHLKLRGDQIHQARLWLNACLARIESAKYCNGADWALRNVSFSFPRPAYDQLKTMLPLAQLAEVYAPCSEVAVLERFVQKPAQFENVLEAMREIFEIGKTAVKEGWHPERLAGYFDAWLSITTGGASGKNLGYKFQMKKREREKKYGKTVWSHT